MSADAVAAPLLAGVAAALYLGAASAVRWRWRRTACFMAGTAVLAGSSAIPTGALPAHMAEHALIVAVAAPLLVMGAPVALAMRTLPAGASAVLAAAMGTRTVRALTHPALTWTLFVAVQWAFHLTPLLEASESRLLLHAVEHGAFLSAGVLFWLPVVGANPVPRRIRGAERAAYLFFAIPAVDIAGAALMARGEPAAGAAMLAGSLPVVLAAVVLTWRWVAGEERRAVLVEGAHETAG